VFHPVDDAMADCRDAWQHWLAVQPVHQRGDRRTSAFSVQSLRYAPTLVFIDDEPHADAIDAVEHAAGAPAQRRAVVDREADARRAGIEGQDATSRRAHR